MAFNWFRRKFDNNPELNPGFNSEGDNQNLESEQKSDAPEQINEQISDKIPESAAETNFAKTSSPDLLAWAKSAYSNIQAQAKSNIAEKPEAKISEIEPDLKLSNISSELISSPEIKDPEVIIQAEEEVRTELLAQAENIIQVEVIEKTESFWAESDRQARIAALKANAIVEPEILTLPEASATSDIRIEPKTESKIELEIKPEAEFLDEGFLWSSQILAAQGRRPQDVSADEILWLKRLRQGLDKTRLSLINQLKFLVGKGPLNADAVDDIEALLLQADVGVKATDLIIQRLQTKIRTEILPPDEAIAFLKQVLREMLEQPLPKTSSGSTPRGLAPEKNQLNVWLITGVNGAGKTTTIGKLAHLAQKSGYNTLIAAADTFRAAAVQQVQVWGKRAGVQVIANLNQNTDPASVVFDAIISAQSKGTELLLVDTAGRLQNKQNLMDELSKIRRIVDTKAKGAKIESLLVLDATLGQNGLKQAEIFSKSAKISGVILTKLDGTSKGGVAIAVVQQLGLPIRFIGAGEGIDDLRPFSSYEFVEALIS